MAKPVLCIVGLGYVGLPLAHAFAKKGYRTIGFDINKERIEALKEGKDRTNELTAKELKEVAIEYSTNPADIGKADIVILAIPTPVTETNKPDLTLLEEASKTVATHMKDGATIVYESTVYPGVTEDLCGGILKKSGKHFKLGYSPERVNPGDKKHTITKIAKVVAGEDEETTDLLCSLYGAIIEAGIHPAPSIKVAEMAKAIENAQRDLNVAYMNEIAKLCEKLEIATKDVLDAAKTKWNFLPFTPGLVGGHCIGVDPYYLLEKAEDLDMELPMIRAARETNDGMAEYIAKQIVAIVGAPRSTPPLIQHSPIEDFNRKDRGAHPKEKPTILVLGLTFKEDVPDRRNSKAPEVVRLLQEAGCTVTEHDPYVTPGKALKGTYDAIVLLVSHKEYLTMPPRDFAKLGKKPCLFYDLKSCFRKQDIEKAGMTYQAL